MKYAFMSFSCPELDIDGMTAAARRFGYDGIELRVSSKHGHGAEPDSGADTRNEIRRKAEESGIALCCVATSCKYADPGTAAEQVRETTRCIKLASDLGAPTIRVFGGKIPEAVSREQAIELVADSLRSVADYAAENGVVVCMETHDHWCDPAHVAAVMKAVDHAAIAVNWDIMHPVRIANATIDLAFGALKPWIRHVHFHDGGAKKDNPQLMPIGEGIVDHRRAVELLHAMGYDGFLSGEWIRWEPWEIHLPRELETMKSYEREAAEAACGG